MTPIVAAAAAAVVEAASVVAAAVAPPPAAAPLGTGEVRCVYNHYNSAFKIEAGAVRASSIDAAYCFSAVFRGEFRLHLVAVDGPAKGERAVEIIRRPRFVMPPDESGDGSGGASGDGSGGAGSPVDPLVADPLLSEPLAIDPLFAAPSACGDVAFLVQGGSTWRVEVEDDPAFPCAPSGIRFLLAAELAAFAPPRGAGAGAAARGGATPGALRVAEATAALKAIDVAELRSGSERVKALLAERDLEDVLYGGAGAISS